MIVIIAIILLVIMLIFRDPYRLPVVHKNVLDVEDVNEILKHSTEFKDSLTVDSKTANHKIRKSKQLSISEETLPHIYKKIRERFNWYGKIEKLQVVKYEPGDFYNAHYDNCCFKECKQDINKRIRTVIVYLTNDFDGGETHFPNLKMSFKPNVGDAIVFDTYNLLGGCSEKALHQGLEVKNGVKYICNFWFRET